jgi:hypothetical protein
MYEEFAGLNVTRSYGYPQSQLPGSNHEDQAASQTKRSATLLAASSAPKLLRA